MKALLYKEWKLALPKGMLLFSLLAVLIVIPNYPVVVGVGYCFLGIHLTFTLARGNSDLEFTAMLPVSRKQIVAAKVAIVAFLELTQILVAVPFALIADLIVSPQGNLVGLDSNLAYFGVVFAGFAAFNLVFLPGYFRTGYRVGIHVVLGVLAFLAVYGLAETLSAVVPAVGAAVDTLNPAAFGVQGGVLALGAAAYAAATYLAFRLSRKSFDRVGI